MLLHKVAFRSVLNLTEGQTLKFVWDDEAGDGGKVYVLDKDGSVTQETTYFTVYRRESGEQDPQV